MSEALSPEERRRAWEIFDCAADLPEAERSGYVERECGTDAALHAELARLLVGLAIGDRAGFMQPAAPSRAGSTIGPFRLIERLGEGGMGEVYLAQQTEPVLRLVALKLIKQGMDTRQVIARFEAERQALALMDHPGIAKVLEASCLETGQPYFVMEYIEGVSILEHCAVQQLDTAARLRLFIGVCHAIQHAHQKGLIHRDIKPANVRVTLQDGRPVAKVIDFGIAKALHSDEGERAPLTEARQLLGTPAYMSPEQAGLTGLDIDTRSDVYALGVLLYELLTGTTPFDSQRLSEQSLPEMLRVICEETPLEPSRRVAALGVTSVQRPVDSRRLGHGLRGDLDWIVMKCLEKDRARRYATAHELAADIERHLAEEPVLAGPPSTAYRLRKYVRRHRLGVIAGTSVALALVAGLAIAILGWRETDLQRIRAEQAENEALAERDAARVARGHAEEEEQRAKSEAARANAVIALTEQMLGAADLGSGRAPGFTVRALLDEFDGPMRSALVDHPEVESSMQAIVGKAYRSLGLYAEAATHLEAALATRRRLDVEAHLIAGTLADLAFVRLSQGRFVEAEALSREALGMVRDLEDDERRLAWHLNQTGSIIQRNGKLAEAEALVRRALDINLRAPGDQHDEVANSSFRLAWILQGQGRFVEAEPLARRVVEHFQQRFGTVHPNIAAALSNLACCLISLERFEEGEQRCREGLAINLQLYGREHDDVSKDLNNLGLALAGQGKLAEAEEKAREAVELEIELTGGERSSLAAYLDNYGKILARQGKFAEAEDKLRQALQMRIRCLGEEHRDVALGLGNLADVLALRGNFVEAEACYQRGIELRGRLREGSFDDALTEIYLLGLAGVLVRQDKLAEAEAAYRGALAIDCGLLGNGAPRVAWVLNKLVQVLEHAGNPAAAETVIRDTLLVDGRLLGKNSNYGAGALNSLTGLLVRQGKLAEAEALWRAELAADRRPDEADDTPVGIDLTNLGNVLKAQGRFAEAEEVLLDAVALCRRLLGPEHKTVATMLDLLIPAQLAQEKYAAAEVSLVDTIEIHGVNGTADDRARANMLAMLGFARLELDKFGEAEQALRQCLDLRTRTPTDPWMRYTALSLLGGAVLGQGRHAEAEPLLLEGYEKMEPPAAAAYRRSEALERVIALYESWGKPEEATAWRAKVGATESPGK